MSGRRILRQNDSHWEDFWAYMHVQGEDVSAQMVKLIRATLVAFQNHFSSGPPPEPAIDETVLLVWDHDADHIDLEFDRSGMVRFFYMKRKSRESFSEENLTPEVLFQEPYLSYWKRLYRH